MISAARIKKIVHVALALFLLVVGLFGLALPILNGIIPITLGLILLSFESKYVERWLDNTAKKNKHVDHWYQKLAHAMRRFFGIES